MNEVQRAVKFLDNGLYLHDGTNITEPLQSLMEAAGSLVGRVEAGDEFGAVTGGEISDLRDSVDALARAILGESDD